MQARTLMDGKREHKGVTRTFQNRKMFETKRMHDRTMAATENERR
jgi:ABC-type branched-subunit amino acid transport system ATPase component